MERYIQESVFLDNMEILFDLNPKVLPLALFYCGFYNKKITCEILLNYYHDHGIENIFSGACAGANFELMAIYYHFGNLDIGIFNAVKYGHISVVKYFHEHGWTYDTFYALWAARDYNQHAIVDYLLTIENLIVDYDMLFSFACKFNHMSHAERCIKNNYIPSTSNFLIACEFGSLKILKTFFFATRITPIETELLREATTKAFQNGHFSLILELNKHVQTIEKDLFKPLQIACHYPDHHQQIINAFYNHIPIEHFKYSMINYQEFKKTTQTIYKICSSVLDFWPKDVQKLMFLYLLGIF